MRRTLISLAAAVLTVALGVSPASAAVNGTEKAVITKTNQYRANAGAPAVASTSCLDRYAEAHAAWMAKNKKLQHQTSTKFQTIMSACKLRGIGENIAYGYPSAGAVTTGWYNSSGHRANMLNASHRHIGVALVKASDGTPYWIQIYGMPR